MVFQIKLAKKVIEIHSIYESVYYYCKNYLVEGEKTDFVVSIEQKDLDYEYQKSLQEAKEENREPYEHKESYYEILAVYRKIVEKLIDSNIFLFHGSVVAYENQAYLFTAKSGTGKTTHTNMWLSQLEGSYIVNGDKPLILLEDDKVYVCGTPWSGKENKNKNVIIPLKAICILDRGENNHIEEISFDEALPMLMQQVYKPKNVIFIQKTMKFINCLNHKLTFYHLWCNMNLEAFSVSYNSMK